MERKKEKWKNIYIPFLFFTFETFSELNFEWFPSGWGKLMSNSGSCLRLIIALSIELSQKNFICYINYLIIADGQDFPRKGKWFGKKLAHLKKTSCFSTVYENASKKNNKIVLKNTFRLLKLLGKFAKDLQLSK